MKSIRGSCNQLDYGAQPIPTFPAPAVRPLVPHERAFDDVVLRSKRIARAPGYLMCMRACARRGTALRYHSASHGFVASSTRPYCCALPPARETGRCCPHRPSSCAGAQFINHAPAARGRDDGFHLKSRTHGGPVLRARLGGPRRIRCTGVGRRRCGTPDQLVWSACMIHPRRRSRPLRPADRVRWFCSCCFVQIDPREYSITAS